MFLSVYRILKALKGFRAKEKKSFRYQKCTHSNEYYSSNNKVNLKNIVEGISNIMH